MRPGDECSTAEGCAVCCDIVMLSFEPPDNHKEPSLESRTAPRSLIECVWSVQGGMRWVAHCLRPYLATQRYLSVDSKDLRLKLANTRVSADSRLDVHSSKGR